MEYRRWKGERQTLLNHLCNHLNLAKVAESVLVGEALFFIQGCSKLFV